MNFLDILSQKYQKQAIHALADWIADDALRFESLMHFFFNDAYRVTQNAAGVMSICIERYPNLILPYWPAMLSSLQSTKHDAIKRNVLRAWQYVPIPDDYQGIIAEMCFQYIQNPKEAIAIRAFAITVLQNICKQQPDLLPEFKALILQNSNETSAAVKHRIKLVMDK